MPARHPKASFEPVRPDLDIEALIGSSRNLRRAVRIPCESIEQQGISAFERLVRLHVIQEGKPLVVDGYQKRLDPTVFSPQFLERRCGDRPENAKNLATRENVAFTIRHYLRCMSLFSNQTFSQDHRDSTAQRLYLKDIDGPEEWYAELKKMLPPFLFYLNGSQLDSAAISPPGDLMSCLPCEMRAENIQCYIGYEGTYTPAHHEMCASLGHNIMVEASSGAPEGDHATIPGRSLWFMTASKDREAVSEFFRNMLGHDIEIEDHFAQVNAWRAAPFDVYLIEQRPGDLILIPPLAAHQVWNRGTRTMKVAWNRTTVDTLELAINETLANARLVCRDEQYKCKAIVYFALLKYSNLLKERTSGWRFDLSDSTMKQLRKDFRNLFALFTDILISESFSVSTPLPASVDLIKFDGNITCSFCRCNIFNRFLTCKNCMGVLDDGGDDTYDICLECYSLGRSCYCMSRLVWCEQFAWKDLLHCHDVWRQQILRSINGTQRTAVIETNTFNSVRRQQKRKTLAEICQEELRRRPFNALGRALSGRELNGDVKRGSNYGHVKSHNCIGRLKRRKLVGQKGDNAAYKTCHICKQLEPDWRVVSCHNCAASYCYGSLFRAFEIYPPEVMGEYQWKCPRCMKICSCGACRRNPAMRPFEPTVTYLGHKTLPFADPRSVEVLVDFSQSNLSWLKKANVP